MARKTWKEKLNNGKLPEVKVLSHGFGSMKEGDQMLIPSPQLIQEYMNSIPPGHQKSIPEMRKELAAKYNAHGTCPLTTGIFSRIVAESALEDAAAGMDEITPFWRVIRPQDNIASKLSCGVEFIRKRRQKEGIHSALAK